MNEKKRIGKTGEDIAAEYLEKLGYRIREAQVTKVPYMVVVGEDEMNSGTVTVRARVEGEGGKFTVDEFTEKLCREIETKKH